MKKIRHYYLAAVIQSALLAVACPVARAQNVTDGYVTRKEYEELKTQLLAMKKELDALKKDKGQERAGSDAVADVHKEVAPKQENAESQAGGDMHQEVTANVVPSVAELEGSL